MPDRIIAPVHKHSCRLNATGLGTIRCWNRTVISAKQNGGQIVRVTEGWRARHKLGSLCLELGSINRELGIIKEQFEAEFEK